MKINISKFLGLNFNESTNIYFMLCLYNLSIYYLQYYNCMLIYSLHITQYK